MLSRLRAFTEDDITDESSIYGVMLAAMCHWGRGADVLELISTWLTTCFTDTVLVPSASKVVFVLTCLA